MKTVYCAAMLSLATFALGKLFPLTQPITGDAMLELIFAIALIAAGSALLFFQNASSGGTDILAKILHEKLHWHIGKSLLAVDFIISVLAVPICGQRAGMYSILGVIAKGLLIDYAIRGMHTSKRLVIVSDKAEQIREYIVEHLQRGVTMYDAVGGKTRRAKTVLDTVMSSREALKLRQYIKSVDERAFVVIDTVTEIYGEGFVPPE